MADIQSKRNERQLRLNEPAVPLRSSPEGKRQPEQFLTRHIYEYSNSSIVKSPERLNTAPEMSSEDVGPEPESLELRVAPVTQEEAPSYMHSAETFGDKTEYQTVVAHTHSTHEDMIGNDVYAPVLAAQVKPQRPKTAHRKKPSLSESKNKVMKMSSRNLSASTSKKQFTTSAYETNVSAKKPKTKSAKDRLLQPTISSQQRKKAVAVEPRSTTPQKVTKRKAPATPNKNLSHSVAKSPMRSVNTRSTPALAKTPQPKAKRVENLSPQFGLQTEVQISEVPERVIQ